MSPAFLLIPILFLGLWLILRARARRRKHAQIAAIFAQREAESLGFDFGLGSWEDAAAKLGREGQRHNRIQNRPAAARLRSRNKAASLSQAASDGEQSSKTANILAQTAENGCGLAPAAAEATPLSPAEPPGGPRSPSKPRPSRKRTIVPKTIEEYEAARKPPPPFPAYLPNTRLMRRIDKLLAHSATPPADSNFQNKPSPTLGGPFSKAKTPRFLSASLAPFRVAAVCVRAVVAIAFVFACFFARTKTPPGPAALSRRNRAA